MMLFRAVPRRGQQVRWRCVQSTPLLDAAEGQATEHSVRLDVDECFQSPEEVLMPDDTLMIRVLANDGLTRGWVTAEHCVRESTVGWRCMPFDNRPVAILGDAKLTAERTGHVLNVGDAFLSCEERLGADGIRFLRLGDERGWVFERLPSQGRVCVRYDLPEEQADAAELRGLLLSFTGSKAVASRLAKRLDQLTDRQERNEQLSTGLINDLNSVMGAGEAASELERRMMDLYLEMQRTVEHSFAAATTQCLSCGFHAPMRPQALLSRSPSPDDDPSLLLSPREHTPVPTRPGSARKAGERPTSARTVSTTASTTVPGGLGGYGRPPANWVVPQHWERRPASASAMRKEDAARKELEDAAAPAGAALAAARAGQAKGKRPLSARAVLGI